MPHLDSTLLMAQQLPNDPPLSPVPVAGQIANLPNFIPPFDDTPPENAWQWNYATIQAFKAAQAAKSKVDTGIAWQGTE